MKQSSKATSQPLSSINTAVINNTIDKIGDKIENIIENENNVSDGSIKDLTRAIQTQNVLKNSPTSLTTTTSLTIDITIIANIIMKIGKKIDKVWKITMTGNDLNFDQPTKKFYNEKFLLTVVNNKETSDINKDERLDKNENW